MQQRRTDIVQRMRALQLSARQRDELQARLVRNEETIESLQREAGRLRDEVTSHMRHLVMSGLDTLAI